ncbi:MAG: zf-TFIIB domain-containing protein [Aeromicrobium sp.]|uniref:TFIIB-type zinc ribbon-containing protein n=1 Tax=Aeromicrobium sp. TaxID=1871063 RepID=UPI0039E5A5AB
MKCPIDEATLVMSERAGVEIDYCPTCRGVWLDRGELDKIIDRAVGEAKPSPAPTPAPQAAPVYREERRYDQGDRYDPRYRKKKKKEHWLMEIFD